MTVTKADLVEEIYQKNNLRKAEAAQALEALLEVMKISLVQADDILISGFGKFVVKQKKERRGRNPQTGAGIMLPARRVITFKPSGVLRQYMNNNKD